MSTANAQPRIVVLGAGYGGLLATVRLAGKVRDADVTLVNQYDAFIQRVRLHQYAAGQTVKRRPLRDILRGTNVRFVQGVAEQIDTTRRQVHVKTGNDAVALTYDHLVYALGSMTDLQHLPGAGEHAYVLAADGPNSADDLKALLPAVSERGGTVAIVGGGPTGTEAAAEFAECFPRLRVMLVTRGDLGPLTTSTIRIRSQWRSWFCSKT